ncbi:hypothetical protein D3C76_1439470 [compost metagenome]
MRRIIPTGCEAFIEFFLSHFQAPLEHGDTFEVSTVLEVFELFAPLHLLQKKLGIMDRDFHRHFMPADGQQVACALGRTLERLIGVVEPRRLLECRPLLTLGSVGKAIRMNAARQLTIARSQLLEIQTETRLQLE